MKFKNLLKGKQKEEDKNKNMTMNTIRIRIKRLLNNTPVEIAVFDADIRKDKDQNLTIINEEQFFKESFDFSTEELIEDIKRKIKSRFNSKEEQLKALEVAIKIQEERLSRIVAGKLKPKVQDNKTLPKDDTWEKVNQISEETRLRLLKVSKFTIENEGNGSYEQIESDGMRCITYIAQDGYLTPMFIKIPSDTKTNEPIEMYKDVSLKRKYAKEATDIAIQDYMNEVNDPVSKALSLVSKVLLVVLVLGCIFLTMHLFNREKDVSAREQALLDKWAESPEGICQQAIANRATDLNTQIENNGVLIEWAKQNIKEELNKTKRNQELPIKI